MNLKNGHWLRTLLSALAMTGRYEAKSRFTDIRDEDARQPALVGRKSFIVEAKMQLRAARNIRIAQFILNKNRFAYTICA
ncbi:hypothetical protein HBDW_08940 [Herbaspirillum sp. DW155]|uniref:hypothetical protein n=1 Tax=Herbaspirillum sp. DW155 TaxID=3095609 RepID=UPI003084F1CB|nr:hypothetical protein HBDW_08940 [Herbaspirillum sp. DW155]